MIVPMTSAPMAEKKVSSIVIPNAPRTLYWDSSSPMRFSALSRASRSRHGQPKGYAARPGERAAYPVFVRLLSQWRRSTQPHAAGVGGLPAPGLKPAGPRFVVHRLLPRAVS